MKLPKSKVTRFFAFGVAVALAIGCAGLLWHFMLPTWVTFVVTAGVGAMSTLVWNLDTVKRFKQPVWVPEAPEGSVPRYDSRRWARACFHNGYITLPELQQFYSTHPEDQRDPDR